MTQNKRKLRLHIAICFNLVMLAFCSASFAQSLVANSAVKSFEENTSTDIVLQVGNGACATSVTKIQVSKNGILLSMNKPKGCKFKNLELTLGSDVYPLSGLGDEFEVEGEHYKWRSNSQKGRLLFSKNENQTPTPLNALRLREINCTEGSCLSGAMILVAVAPPKLVTPVQVPMSAPVLISAPAPAQITASVVKVETPEPRQQQALAVQNQPRGVCTDNGDGTFTGKDGTVWQKCVVGQSWENGRCVGERKIVNWFEAITVAKNDRFLGYTDWVIPTEQLFRKTLINDGCNDHQSIKKRDSESVLGYWWTSTPGKSNSQAEIMSENTGGGSAYLEYIARTKNDWNGRPVGIGVTLVRIPTLSDTAIILNSLSRAENEISKRSQNTK